MNTATSAQPIVFVVVSQHLDDRLGFDLVSELFRAEALIADLPFKVSALPCYKGLAGRSDRSSGHLAEATSGSHRLRIQRLRVWSGCRPQGRWLEL
jgi:hypothetical protein